MHECINVKNPPNCVGGIHVFIRVSFLASLLLALLLNTSSQFYTVAYYYLVFYSYFFFAYEYQNIAVYSTDFKSAEIIGKSAHRKSYLPKTFPS
jgi:hypothetical protein